MLAPRRSRRMLRGEEGGGPLRSSTPWPNREDRLCTPPPPSAPSWSTSSRQLPGRFFKVTIYFGEVGRAALSRRVCCVSDCNLDSKTISGWMVRCWCSMERCGMLLGSDPCISSPT